jgi:hypothetical protein
VFTHHRARDGEPLRLVVDLDRQAIHLADGLGTVTITAEELRWVVLATGPAALDTLRKATRP